MRFKNSLKLLDDLLPVQTQILSVAALLEIKANNDKKLSFVLSLKSSGILLQRQIWSIFRLKINSATNKHTGRIWKALEVGSKLK